MRTYEVLFIVSPKLSDEDATNLIAEFKTIAEKNDGSVVSEDAWGRRRLASPIDKLTEGVYHLFVIQSESDPHELDRRMKNSDQVVRHMIVRTDLDQKRAAKLAKKNPPKQRTGSPGSVTAANAAAVAAAAAAAPAPSAAPAAEVAAEVAVPAPSAAPAAEIAAEVPAEVAAETAPAAEASAPAAEVPATEAVAE